MRTILTFCLSFVSFLFVFAQEEVVYSTAKNSVKLPFKLVNNLIILPVKVNGVVLNFLVDTGVEETILFSLDEKEEIKLYQVEKIKLKGLGTQEAVEGLKTYRNKLAFGNLELKNQEIIVVLDQNFNFSSSLGIEVNGIMGYDFFSQNVVKLDYKKKKIVIYKPDKFNKKKLLSKFQAFDFTLENGKPYLKMQVELNHQIFDIKCLIDSGNSDGLWLFSTPKNKIVVPELNFEDYLGRGFSGDVYGKKAKIKTLSLDKFKFEQVITAFPDAISFSNVKKVDDRSGSIGGEVLKRFDVVFDYRNQKLYLKKNTFYNDKFRYNVTGISIQHAGLQWYKEQIPLRSFDASQENHYKQINGAELKYNFKLLPIYEILTIRKNSPAEKAGLKAADVLISINGNKVYKMDLDKVNRLLQTNNRENIKIVVARNGIEISYEFKVIDLL